MMTRWPSPAKLNLFLYITGQRADGYHTLQTLFQFLDYGDTLTIEPRTDGQLRLLTPVAGVPDEENLIVRAQNKRILVALNGAGKHEFLTLLIAQYFTHAKTAWPRSRREWAANAAGFRPGRKAWRKPAFAPNPGP